ncbi:hypothetical protein EJ03DRAFT_279974 [Teratosphaeria nubilosa]|uniref:Uncharacterized protein n=1 Tax=Teratosphaeria nubilosa TaxID=161662 RepID=A0A6G1KXV3_9PEZI|nr:hypothetical protein EJ03DRAFT_279974 [Teratosphaeria nubilosa]
MLSPAASSTPSTSASDRTALPHPRNSPLRPGGSKESAFIRYVDQQILHIQRRFAKRTSPTGHGLSDIDRDKADDWGDVKGYSSIREVCKDIEELVGVVWVSGTPSLQVPYLINLALLLSTVIPAMPPTPKQLFRVLGKLDHAFASLNQGQDVDTGEALPGFFGKKGINGTEQVRIRSLVERTRVITVEAFKRGEFEVEELDDGDDWQDRDKMETDTEGELVLEGGRQELDEEEASIDMQLSRVYYRTIQELGDSLEPPSIGIITEKRG